VTNKEGQPNTEGYPIEPGVIGAEGESQPIGVPSKPAPSSLVRSVTPTIVESTVVSTLKIVS